MESFGYIFIFVVGKREKEDVVSDHKVVASWRYGPLWEKKWASFTGREKEEKGLRPRIYRVVTHSFLCPNVAVQ